MVCAAWFKYIAVADISGIEMIVDDLKKGIDAELHPGTGTKAKMSVGKAFGMYYRFSVIPLVLAIIVALIVGATVGTALGGLGLGALGGGAAAVIAVVGVVVSLWIIMPISMLVVSAILHAIGRALGMFKGTYANTFTGVVYSEFPTVSVYWLSFIPIIGTIIAFLAGLYGIWVFLKAEANQNNTTLVNAFIVGLITVVIIAVVVFVLVGAAALSLFGGLSALGAGAHGAA